MIDRNKHNGLHRRRESQETKEEMEARIALLVEEQLREEQKNHNEQDDVFNPLCVSLHRYLCTICVGLILIGIILTGSLYYCDVDGHRGLQMMIPPDFARFFGQWKYPDSCPTKPAERRPDEKVVTPAIAEPDTEVTAPAGDADRAADSPKGGITLWIHPEYSEKFSIHVAQDASVQDVRAELTRLDKPFGSISIKHGDDELNDDGMILADAGVGHETTLQVAWRPYVYFEMPQDDSSPNVKLSDDNQVATFDVPSGRDQPKQWVETKPKMNKYGAVKVTIEIEDIISDDDMDYISIQVNNDGVWQRDVHEFRVWKDTKITFLEKQDSIDIMVRSRKGYFQPKIYWSVKISTWHSKVRVRGQEK